MPKTIEHEWTPGEVETLAQTIADLTPGEPILQFFAFAHLPEHLRFVSATFANLACGVVIGLPRNPERTVALRKLLEAKDAAVRARLFR